MVALALNYGQGSALLKDIARREGISEKYLGQIIIPLKASGLVVSHRGAHGGYALARAPEGITVKDVVEAIEGAIAPVPCVDPGRGRKPRGVRRRSHRVRPCHDLRGNACLEKAAR